MSVWDVDLSGHWTRDSEIIANVALCLLRIYATVC